VASGRVRATVRFRLRVRVRVRVRVSGGRVVVGGGCSMACVRLVRGRVRAWAS
jgi:hypothetical protein